MAIVFSFLDALNYYKKYLTNIFVLVFLVFELITCFTILFHQGTYYTSPEQDKHVLSKIRNCFIRLWP